MSKVNFKDLYVMIENKINSACKDKNELLNYLDIQSKFYYSVNNCFLVLAQKPNAILLKEEDYWVKKDKVNILLNEKPIIIIEPIRGNYNFVEDYKMKYLYDITQTTAKGIPPLNTYSDRELLKAMLNCYNFKFTTVDKLVDDKNANLDLGENILYIKKGVQSPKVFYAILEELVKIELKTDSTNELEVFQNRCCTYMLLKKYGIDSNYYDIGSIPYELERLSIQDKKNVFNLMRVAVLEIDNRMDKYFNFIHKNNKKKEYER